VLAIAAQARHFTMPGMGMAELHEHAPAIAGAGIYSMATPPASGAVARPPRPLAPRPARRAVAGGGDRPPAHAALPGALGSAGRPLGRAALRTGRGTAWTSRHRRSAGRRSSTRR
jgi:hypothetical protein